MTQGGLLVKILQYVKNSPDDNLCLLRKDYLELFPGYSKNAVEEAIQSAIDQGYITAALSAPASNGFINVRLERKGEIFLDNPEV